ncbi:MAG: glycosyltransferase [Ignavibacteriaceae bacterium]
MESNLLLLFFITLILWYFYFLLKILKGLNRLNSSTKRSINEFVTVIIPFRNESGNILASLKSITNLDYPNEKFEVIYINDNSNDDSLEKLMSAKKPANVNVISVPVSDAPGAFKKRAVAYAIEKSQGDIIVTTDADCIHPPGWLGALLFLFDEQTALVSGPVEFYESNSFLNKIQKLEFQGLILAGAGLIGAGDPVICSAANLAYRKKVFIEVNGFSDQLHLTSGDDELLMQKIHKTGKYKIKYCADPGAIVKTSFNNTMEEFFYQRKRWASKGLFYADKILIFRLGLIFLYYLSIPFLIILSFFSQIYLFILFFSLSIKFITEYLIMKKGNELIFRSPLLKYFLPAEILQIPYIIIAGISGAFGNFKWKGRDIKR